MIRPPIILSERGALLFFRSAEDAERFVEPIDVENGEYVAYDCEGRRLQLSVGTGLFGPVSIDERVNTPTHQEELRNLLIAFLERHGEDVTSVASPPVPSLVERAVVYGGFTR